MTHDEKRLFLIKALLAESMKYPDMEVSDEAYFQDKLLRGLMNMRLPKPVSTEFIKIQDQYLSEKVRLKGVVSAEKILSVRDEFESILPSADRISLWKGDITRLDADAIVNAANTTMLGCFIPCHGCVDNIIHSISGVQLRLACNEMMKGHKEPVGSARLTSAFNLPSKYVLHTVGPVVSGELTKKQCHQLSSCYSSCLELAAKNQLKSVAFCCISTGEFLFPRAKAAEIAIKTVTDFLKKSTEIKKVIFNVFKEEDYDIYRGIICNG